MKHSEFVTALAHDLGSSRSEARRVLEAFVRSFYLGLVRDGQLTIQDLGTFTIRESSAREMYSKISGRTQLVPGSKRTTMRMAAGLRRALREEVAE